MFDKRQNVKGALHLPKAQASQNLTDFRAGGYCTCCKKNHYLGPGNTLEIGTELMDFLEREKSIDIISKKDKKRPVSPNTSTSHLFGEARGKMFGVMEALTVKKEKVILYAFSGQFNGKWEIEGWVPPVFDVTNFYALTTTTEKEIKKLGKDISACKPHSEVWLTLRKNRRELSRNLMRQILGLYWIANFRGDKLPLTTAFLNPQAIPTGTGDCCAPKLLQYAALNSLRPLGICEFFWGKETKSGSHQHGTFSVPCKEKCEPLLGYMLCGLH